MNKKEMNKKEMNKKEMNKKEMNLTPILKINNIKELVLQMRKPICYKNKCLIEKNILYKCILCKKYLSSNQWGPMLEKYIKELFLLKKPKNNTSGDGCSMNNKKIEIKVSLGDSNGQFNFVQIRPDHDIDYYILMCYNVFDDELGKIYWFLCPSGELYKLLPEYGSYAHGTITKLGKIEPHNIYGHNHEYALRPNVIKKTALWNKLIDCFSCDEKHIMTLLH
jgi:hypothetical protein